MKILKAFEVMIYTWKRLGITLKNSGPKYD